MTVAVEPIKVLIADDHALFRAGLAQMLSADRRMRVVGEARDGIEAVEQAIASHPDVVLMDLQMPRADGIEATRMISGRAPDVDVVLLSALTDETIVGAGLESGAKAFMHKDVSLQDAVAMILDVRSARGVPPRDVENELSKRELNVLEKVAAGFSNKQIARLLGISEKTVRNHLSKAFTKLGVTNRTEAVMHALHAGFLVV